MGSLQKALVGVTTTMEADYIDKCIHAASDKGRLLMEKRAQEEAELRVKHAAEQRALEQETISTRAPTALGLHDC